MRGNIVTKIAMPTPPEMNTTQSQKYGGTMSIPSPSAGWRSEQAAAATQRR